ncbi:phage baseplate protein [Rhizobium nepotum]|uniref:phage baseplate protein n=1 Tax=Rhizobium nepotum TaxID=1035271 RepID=UPI00336A6134
MSDADIIVREFRGLYKNIDDLNRRFVASQMTGRVAEIDGSRVRLELAAAGANGKPFLSPWVQVQEAAGATGTNMPVEIGDPMRLFSPNGEIGSQSLAIRDSHTADAQNPAGTPKELAITYAGSAIRMTAEGLKLSHGGSSITISEDTIHALSSHLRHNEKNVGDSHNHGGIRRGGENTFEPNE